MWIRYPLVPGINDTEEDLRMLGRFVAGLASVRSLQLLPYHQAAEEKARRAGRDCQLQGVSPPDQVTVERCREWVQEEISVPVSIGG